MGLRRLELPEEMAHYFDEHVEADAVHEQVAVRHICQRLVDLEPELADDVLLGAAVCVLLEARSAEAMIAAWERGESTLLRRAGEGGGMSPRLAGVQDAPEVEVTLCPGGPALVRGATVVRDEAGTPHEVTRPDRGGVPVRQDPASALV